MEIESIWYQVKMTGYRPEGPFPTERMVLYTVGETVVLPSNKSQMCEKIEEDSDGVWVVLEKSKLFIPKETKPEILYKRGDTEDKIE